MRRECRERFPRHRLQTKPLVSDPGMHHGTCATHLSWCMSGSLNPRWGENVPGIPSACETRKFTYLVRGPRSNHLLYPEWHTASCTQGETNSEGIASCRLRISPGTKKTAISPTIFSDAFSWMKNSIFWLKFHLSLFLRFKLTLMQHWFR